MHPSISTTNQKVGSVSTDALFQESIGDTSDITDDRCYYCGLLYGPCTASYSCKMGTLIATADAKNGQGICPQSCATTFRVLLYGANNHIFPILFYHSIETKCSTTYNTVVDSLKQMLGFYVEGLATIVDQQTSIYSSYREVKDHAEIFIDSIHVEKNVPKIDAEKSNGIRFYQKDLRALSAAEVHARKHQYEPKKCQHFFWFKEFGQYNLLFSSSRSR